MAATEPSHPSSQQQPSIPRIQCSRCGTIMRLARIEPDPTVSQSSLMIFDCQCGFAYQQSERARADS